MGSAKERRRNLMSDLTSVLGMWNVTTRGWSGQLNISSVDGQGNLSGTLTITTTDQGSPTGEAATPISGYWNADAQEIWFVRDMKNIHPNDALPIQVYTAYGYSYTTQIGGSFREALAGFFEALISADKHRFGWVASREIIP
jgi:hypothetical protein